MPIVNPSPFGPKPQFELSNGLPAVGNQLFFYVAGSVNTKQDTYTDSTGTVANTNPIVLNALGEPTTEIWFTSGQSYKVIYAPSNDTDPPTSPIWSVDNLRGINDATLTIDQWISGPTPTFIGGTQFTLSGDQTSIFTVGRRVRTINSGGTVYGTITVSSFGGAITTITVINDSGALDSGLSAVSYGILTSNNSSIPGVRLVSGAWTLQNNTAIESTDAGATAGPILDLYRNSASPAISDLIGQVAFSGNNTTPARITGASILAVLSDPTPGAESFAFVYQTRQSGTTANRMIVAAGAYMAGVTGTDKGAGTFNATGIYSGGDQIRPRITNAAVATTSGTSVAISGSIPTWATKITLSLFGVSTNGVGTIQFQIGPSSGVVGVGYVGGASVLPNAGAIVGANYTSGFGISGNNAAAALYQGSGTLSLQNASTNTWTWSFSGARSDAGASCIGGGSISLAGPLEDILLTNSAGDTFDAGSVGLTYE